MRDKMQYLRHESRSRTIREEEEREERVMGECI
jgi:hypothetical protein